MKTVIIAEKPSVGRLIAKVLGVGQENDGYIANAEYVVTWAVGHLVKWLDPQAMDPELKHWNFAHLPIVPKTWKTEVLPDTKRQFDIIERLINADDTHKIICATDAGREGELIFRLIYEHARCTKPIERLWISSLTDEAIKTGFKQLKSGKEYAPLAASAKARSQADWLVGMNFSRAYSLQMGDLLPVGRVQTPTLAMVVERELAIQAFKPETYFRLQGRFACTSEAYNADHVRMHKKKWQKPRLTKDEGESVRARCLQAPAPRIADVKRETTRTPPLQLFELTSLQRYLNRRSGFSADKTLGLCQELYERHQMITYPRTDSAYLSTTVAKELSDTVDVLRAHYPNAPECTQALGPRFVNDAKVTEHHAIIPTGRIKALQGDLHTVFDAICRRFLNAWSDDHVVETITLLTQSAKEMFKSTYSTVRTMGWRILEPEAKPQTPQPAWLAHLGVDTTVTLRSIKLKEESTSAPPRLTDASLLTGMETAAAVLKEVRSAKYETHSGLGTPATRAQTIEGLISRGYMRRDGRALIATDKALRLIQGMHPNLKSAQLTAEWEKRLNAIAHGKDDSERFLAEITAFTGDLIAELRTIKVLAPIHRTYDSERAHGMLAKNFGHDQFRPHQEAVCKALIEGHSVLLVMPTGAGKSICYQLPGLYSDQCTVVVSPLISLIEDQVQKLKARGIPSERIHSGRSRDDSREACRLYLQGTLRFLFIAPERLALPGFVELLTKRRPGLIAVDEAHCISQWGHDFRPHYRMLRDRLEAFPGVPRIAVTATATTDVQDDIVEQLGLKDCQRFICGFRRKNLGIAVHSYAKSDPAELVFPLIARESQRPAIVYTSTRKMADKIARSIGFHYAAKAYHAGLEQGIRYDVQEAFFAGKLDVVVATIAFGMGIDKADVRSVIHVGLPRSVEGYYQEIGRAGRDGEFAQASLFHNYGDVKTHEYFERKDYPEVATLTSILDLVPKNGTHRATLETSKWSTAELDSALQKLWVHGAVSITSDQYIAPTGKLNWEFSYLCQKKSKSQQLAAMLSFTANSKRCRMVQLITHFGDIFDDRERCGLCDICRTRKPTRRTGVSHLPRASGAFRTIDPGAMLL